jgi:hypothetical protein
MRRFVALLIFGLSFLALGCASQTEIQPSLEEEQKTYQTETLSLLPLTVETYEWLLKNPPITNKTWEHPIKKNIMMALENEFNSQSVSIKVIPETSLTNDQKINLQETKALFVNLMKNKLHPEFTFLAPRKPVDYSLGREVRFLDPEANLLLLISGFQDISTMHRKGGAVGQAIFVGLVDGQTGKIIWKGHGVEYESGEGLKNPDVAKSLLEYAFRDFPWEQLRSGEFQK